MIQSIVFDIGGVLIRTEDRSGRKEIEEKYHLPPGGADELVFQSQAALDSTIGKSKVDNIWQNVAQQLRLSSQSLEAFKKAFWAGDILDQALLQFIQSCRPRFITAFLTNAWQGARKSLAEDFGIIEGQTVDHLLISSELGIAKPDQRIYRMLSEKIKCRYDQMLFVDDFLENIEAAKALGIDTIHYRPGMNLINEIESIINQ